MPKRSLTNVERSAVSSQKGCAIEDDGERAESANCPTFVGPNSLAPILTVPSDAPTDGEPNHCRTLTTRASTKKESELDALVGLVQRAQAHEAAAILELLSQFAPLLSKCERRLCDAFPYEESAVWHSEVRYVCLMLLTRFDAQRGVPFTGYLNRMLALWMRWIFRVLRRERTLLWSQVSPLCECVKKNGTDQDLSKVYHFNLQNNLTSEVLLGVWWSEALSELPRRQGAVMVLTVQGYTDREVAQILGVRQATVSEAKQAARKKLQKKWAE